MAAPHRVIVQISIVCKKENPSHHKKNVRERPANYIYRQPAQPAAKIWGKS